MKFGMVEKPLSNLYDKKRIYCTNKKYKTSIKSWIKTIHWHEYSAKKKQNLILKNIFPVDEQCSFEKTKENVTKHRDIKLVITKAKGNYLVSERNYHTSKVFPEKLSATEIFKKSQKFMNSENCKTSDHYRLSLPNLTE